MNIADLLDAGYEVGLHRSGDGYTAHIDHLGYGCTAGGATPEAALLNAWPPDVPAPCLAVSPDGDPCTVTGTHSWHYGPDTGAGIRRMWTDDGTAALPEPTIADDVQTLSADMADVFDRLDALEAYRDSDVSLLARTIAHLLGAARPGGTS